MSDVGCWTFHPPSPRPFPSPVFLVVSIKARGSIRAVSGKVFSVLTNRMAARTARFALPAILLTITLAARAQSNGLYSAASATNSVARAKVVIVEDPLATDAFQPRPARVRAMVDHGVIAVTGKAKIADAWLSLITTNDTVGIKVVSEPGPNSGTRPAVVAAVIEELRAAGLPADHIIIWDKHH